MTTGRGAYQAKKPTGPLASLGQRIRAVRITWGWTQGTLAKALGSVQSLVSEWEKDVSRPSGASLTALAAAGGNTLGATQRDELGTRMTSVHIEAAQKRSKDLAVELAKNATKPKAKARK